MRAAAILTLLAASACSLTAGFDGFVGAGPSPDANRDGEIVPIGEGDDGGPGGPDGTDGGPGTDASTVDPNGPPRFVDGGSFCSGQTTTSFCEDFDVEDLPKKWLREGPYAKLTTHASKSAPNTFLVNVPATQAGGTFVSKVTHAFDTPATSMVVTFDFLPERIYVGASFFILAALEWTRAEQKYSLRLVYINGEVRLEESNLLPPPDAKDQYHPLFGVALGKWSKISLDVVASGATPGAQLSLDGVPVGTRETITPTVGIDARPTLILGAVFAGNPHTGWTLRYDDVTVTFR